MNLGHLGAAAGYPPYPSSKQVGTSQPVTTPGAYPPYPPNMQGAPPAVAPTPAVVQPPAPPPPPPPPPLVTPAVLPTIPTTTATIQAGHRYSMSMPAAGLLPAGPTPTIQQAQSMVDALAPGAMRVVSVSPTGIVFDALSLLGSIPLPPGMSVTDLGLSPAAPPAVIPPPGVVPTPVAPPAVVPTPTPGAQSITLVPGTIPQAVNFAPGTPIVVNLPPGATWQSASLNLLNTPMLGPNPVTPGTSTPLQLAVPPGPATLAAIWLDSTGTQQMNALIFLPQGATLSTPITDPATVSAVQTLLNTIAAQAAAQVGQPVAPGFPPLPAIPQIPVSGNATDPAFVAALAAAQQWLNGMLANPPQPPASAGTPPLGPTVSQMNTQGLLDYATLAMLSLPL